MKNNTDFLQVAEVVNDNSYLTAYASKIKEDDDDINISLKKDQKTVEYQETLKIYVENIGKKIYIYIDQYMKLSMLHFLRKLNCFHKHV